MACSREQANAEAASFSRRELLGRGATVAGAAGAAAIFNPALGRAAARRKAQVADTIITNARVITVDRNLPAAAAVAIAGGRLIAVGSEADVLATRASGTEVIDGRGGTVMPGIHDGHSHPFSGGEQLEAASLNYAQLTIPQFVKRVTRLAKKSADEEPDGWLVVQLWDATAMSPLPDKGDLDRIDTRRPILVYSLDGHIALANSRALKLARISKRTPDPPGGEIRRSKKGKPTGILLDNAIGLVARLIPPPTAEDDADTLAAGYELMAQAGITSCLHAAADERELKALKALASRGPLAVRAHVALLVEAEEAEDPSAMLQRVHSLRKQYERPGMLVDNLKLFFDGVIEYPTQTAALLEPYRVNKGTRKKPKFVPGKDRGPTYWPPAVAGPAIAAADAAGWQVHVHAIGDRAVRSALDAFEAARGANGETDNRHTITHLELVDPQDFPRFAELGVMASMQMQWAERDAYTVDKLRGYLGRRRYRYVYPAGSLRGAGATLCGGSDWPVDPLLPMRQIEMAVNRTADEIYAGYPEPLRKAQGINLPSSLEMHTANSAFQLHQEGATGRLRAGMDADLVLLDRDILAVPLTRVSKARPLLTMLAGRTTHRDGV